MRFLLRNMFVYSVLQNVLLLLCSISLFAKIQLFFQSCTLSVACGKVACLFFLHLVVVFPIFICNFANGFKPYLKE